MGELFVTGVARQVGAHRTASLDSPRLRVAGGAAEYVVVWAAESGSGADIVLTENDVEQPAARQGGHLRRLLRALRAASAWSSPTWSRSSSAAPSASTSTSRRPSTSACCPTCRVERFSYLGNTSALGAYTALLCVDMRHEVLDVAAKMTYLELSADNTFMDEYTSALFLPHTDLERSRAYRRCSPGGRAAAQPASARRPQRKKGPHDLHHRPRRQGRHRQDHHRRPARSASWRRQAAGAGHRRRPGQQPEHGARPAAGAHRRRHPRGDQREGAQQPARGRRGQAATCSTTRSTPASSRARASTCSPWAAPRARAATAPPTACCAASSTASPTATLGRDRQRGRPGAPLAGAPRATSTSCSSSATRRVRGITTAGRVVALVDELKTRVGRALADRQPVPPTGLYARAEARHRGPRPGPAGRPARRPRVARLDAAGQPLVGLPADNAAGDGDARRRRRPCSPAAKGGRRC